MEASFVLSAHIFVKVSRHRGLAMTIYYIRLELGHRFDEVDSISSHGKGLQHIETDDGETQDLVASN
jgi:hypothetical protein